jgi:hypothetical protein
MSRIVTCRQQHRFTSGVGDAKHADYDECSVTTFSSTDPSDERSSSLFANDALSAEEMTAKADSFKSKVATSVSPETSIFSDSTIGREGTEQTISSYSTTTTAKKRKKLQSTNATSSNRSNKRIRLIPQRIPITKSTKFMATSSSIYAAVCQYTSIRDALHSSDECNQSYSNGMCSLIRLHFGHCDIFMEQYNTILASTVSSYFTPSDTSARNDKDGTNPNTSSPYFSLNSNKSKSASTIERAFHKAVRHTCDKACFLRAYGPIREYCFLWRDLCVDGNEDDVEGGEDAKAGSDKSNKSTRDGDDSKECMNSGDWFESRVSSLAATSEFIGVNTNKSLPSKAQLLNGWICHLIPPTMCKEESQRQSPATNTITSVPSKAKSTRKRKEPSICTSIYISPQGDELKTKAKVLKHISNTLDDDNSLSSTTNATIAAVPSQPTPLVHHVTSLHPLYSPLGLLEELFIDNPWKLLLSTILLNKTQRNQVDIALFSLLQRWPRVHSMARADWEEIREIISPLGLMNKRSKSIIRFSKEYIDLVAMKEKSLCAPSNNDVDGILYDDATTTKKDTTTTTGTNSVEEYRLTKKEVLSLHQCGEYAWTAYQIFIRNELPVVEGSVKACDHALQLYVEYRLGLRSMWHLGKSQGIT